MTYGTKIDTKLERAYEIARAFMINNRNSIFEKYNNNQLAIRVSDDFLAVTILESDKDVVKLMSRYGNGETIGGLMVYGSLEDLTEETERSIMMGVMD